MEYPSPERLKTLELFAWVGEDDRDGTDVIGLKQGLVPAGYIPLVATAQEKLDRNILMVAMGTQAAVCGKKIYLCRFTFAEVMNQTHAGKPL